MQRHPELHFGHSTPALYAWLQQHRPALFAEIQQAMQQGRWSRLMDRGWRAIAPWWPAPRCCGNSKKGRPTATSSFRAGSTPWPGYRTALVSAAGCRPFAEPAACAGSAPTNCFGTAPTPSPTASFAGGTPGEDVLALMSAPIGTGGDPLAMAAYSQQWQQSTGIPQGLWLPGVGDHGGGPSQEMLEQLQLWQSSCSAHQLNLELVRSYLNELEKHQGQLPLWRDELYLSCIGVAPPAGQTSATTAPWSAAAGGRSGASPQRPAAQRARAMAHAAVPAVSRPSFLAPRFLRCLSKPSRSGTKRAGSAASGAIRPWQPCCR